MVIRDRLSSGIGQAIIYDAESYAEMALMPVADSCVSFSILVPPRAIARIHEMR